MRRHIWLSGAGLAILIVLFALVAWPRGDGDGGGGPLNAIAEAAVKTQSQGGGRAAVRGVVTESGISKPLTFTGQMVYDGAGSARGTLTMPNPKSGGPLKFDYVLEGTQMYMRPSRFGELPEGRKWIGLDFALGDEVDASAPAGGDVKGELDLLSKASGGVEKVGKEDVRGVVTTRYRGTISVADSVKRLREVGADTLATYTEEKGSPIHLESWIDGKGLVRRVQIAVSKPDEGGNGPTAIETRTDFYDFGLEPEIEAPDSDEVLDATSLAKERLEASSGR
jgi:hypothetical protein